MDQDRFINNQSSERQNLKPLLVYDGACGFCRFWIESWRKIAAQQIDFAAFQDIEGDFPQISQEQFSQAIQLIFPDGKVYSGAEAVFRFLAFNQNYAWLLYAYQYVPFARPVCNWYYNLVANNRQIISQLFGISCATGLPPFNWSRWLFLRCIGVIYFIAFFSLSHQIIGLIGAQGVLPAQELLQHMCDSSGTSSYLFLPTLFWFCPTDQFLQFLVFAGAFLSVFVIAGILTAPTLVILWLFYLSLVTISGDFLSFQWDSLLLETGFLACFFAPWQFVEQPLPGISSDPDNQPSSPLVLWLLRIVLFKVIFMSGVVKLLSGDASWQNLTALSYHWYTQPLPTPAAWYMEQLPFVFQKTCCLFMFVFELLVPLLIFAPKRIRHVGAFLIIFFQLLIIVTGNYTFFNYLTIALSILLFEDSLLERFMPETFVKLFYKSKGICSISPVSTSLRNALILAVSALYVFVSVAKLQQWFFRYDLLPHFEQSVLSAVDPFRSINDYGVFAIMTTVRSEIIVQGSTDGKKWLAYKFKYKPQDLNQPLHWVAPYQPRLDWQMWFAALGTYQNNRWFVNFMARLLQGSPDVLALLESSPFGKMPPRYVRAVTYDYHFTNQAEKKATGNWWQSKFTGLYFPSVSLMR